MRNVVEAAKSVAHFMDLKDVYYSVPLSRLLIRHIDNKLMVYEVRYETALEQCHVATITIGKILSADPYRIVTDCYTISDNCESLAISYHSTPKQHKDITYDIVILNHDWKISIVADGVILHRLTESSIPASASLCHDRCQESVKKWLLKTPEVRPDLQKMVDLCWWVLGINTIQLRGHTNARSVVPSKLGYVGLWQWDAYFIALGLAHGDAELAREQIDIALSFPSLTGQLPDVVHEQGVLMSSDDLPESDKITLLNNSFDCSKKVPLTKPPLTAWTIQGLMTRGAAQKEDLLRWLPTVYASQEWWFNFSDSDNDGLPEYLHPYSSGLDDSPVFDLAVPLASPDLTSYLILQDGILAQQFKQLGKLDFARTCEERRAHTLKLLVSTWNKNTGKFHAANRIKDNLPRTILNFFPLLTADLPNHIQNSLLVDLLDPTRFWLNNPLPTVAADEPEFQARRMWRGPVWINTNYLVSEGLRLSGRPRLAEKLERTTLDLVLKCGGPFEYFDAKNATPADGATSCFGWSAALFIDIAVRHSR